MSDLGPAPERPSTPHDWRTPAPAVHPAAAKSKSPPPGTPAFAAAALIAGAVAGITFDSDTLGLNVVLIAAALAVAAMLASRGRAGRFGMVWGALALALASIAFVRDAEWVVIPSLVGAAGYASLAMTGGTAGAAIIRGLLTALAAMPVGPVAVARSAVPAMPRLARSGAAPVLRGLVIGTALLAVFGLLFASADRAFAELVDEAVPTLDEIGSLPTRAWWAALTIAFAGALAVAAVSKPRDEDNPLGEDPDPHPRKPLGAIEWGIALGSLVGLFAAFVAVQATVLFGKDEHVLRTAGLTYADYAHQGFGQLLVVALLTLVVVAVALRVSRTRTPVHRVVLHGLLIVLCALTLVIVASALHRLDLYQDAFGASRLRLSADAFTLTIGGVFVLTIAALTRPSAPWLPRACTLLAGVALLAFGVSDPDRRVADRNVTRFEETGTIDLQYLDTLSADAVPALVRLPIEERDETLLSQRLALHEDDGIWGLNLARERARDALDGD